MAQVFESDNSFKKVNLSTNRYRTDQGCPTILNVVKRVEADLCRDRLDKVKLLA